MNYIYDIVLNFNKYYYNFYEWNNSDKIITIRKIPLYRVYSNIYNDFMKNDLCVDEEFINILKKDLGKIKKNMFLVSDGDRSMGVLIDDSGKVIKRSSLLLDEEEEVCEYAMELNITKINFSYNNKLYKNIELRFIYNIKNYLIKYLNNIDNDMVWKYLYYECFMEEENNIDKIKKTLLEITNKGYSDDYIKLYNSVLEFNKIKN